MKVQILGTGCPKCKMLEANAREALTEIGLDAELVKVDNIDDIMDMGVMVTPALAIDGDVKSAGKLLTKDQIITILKEVK
ncbi:MAG: redox-active disulfide protein 2 [Spirochaetes bacterium GWF1_31_7]|nr:MAG: redox-active disulfide protein 2 [Spirochaetes bacterium GWE1_32_154]OHD47837.1 MAG: redox-active disulfide protein 2 [Spirochaetes bacterium GWF1_31_7]OHD52199.1 MAG: redox-active disulfide protein 2 [Spirochaetes bacterium GWE2_31_10]OHD79332.1 MAG: redox-active disulfide protein 2 [Spirochaetes bacterium RIFOXYB1_FULL_32_8]HBD93177.1 thioredoxin family protein [Spirochaetia bacterium]